MADMQRPGRSVWLWLFREGGRYTAAEIAKQFGWHVDYALACLFSMQRHNMIQKFPPAEGSRRQRYGVTGTCRVPQGLCVAEVQA